MSRTATLAGIASALALLTAACGETPGQRAVTGGAIGAASGAVVGSTVGAPISGRSDRRRGRCGCRRGDDSA